MEAWVHLRRCLYDDANWDWYETENWLSMLIILKQRAENAESMHVAIINLSWYVFDDTLIKMRWQAEKMQLTMT